MLTTIGLSLVMYSSLNPKSAWTRFVTSTLFDVFVFVEVDVDDGKNGQWELGDFVVDVLVVVVDDPDVL
jgi:hypothetical protein